MDSTSIITQVNKDDESVEVSPYTQAKRKYFSGFHIAHLLPVACLSSGANFVHSFVCNPGEISSAMKKPWPSRLKLS